MENAYDRRERTIYVSGMHRSVTEEHLYDLFQKAGPIEKVILKENQDGSPQHALVVFKNVDSVMYSIAYLQATQIGDLSINIRPLRESSHHTALESAMVRMAGGTGVSSPTAELQSPSATHQVPYNLRSHARAQQQAAASSGYPPVSPPPHYNGPLGASLFAPMTLQGAYSGASSFYGGSGSSGQQFGQPMSPTFGQSFRASAQAAPGYGRYSDPYSASK